jgi:hypothetical protein
MTIMKPDSSTKLKYMWGPEVERAKRESKKAQQRKVRADRLDERSKHRVKEVDGRYLKNGNCLIAFVSQGGEASNEAIDKQNAA